MKCTECRRPFKDAYLRLEGLERKTSDGKSTHFWPVCASCRPTVWKRYLEQCNAERKDETGPAKA